MNSFVASLQQLLAALASNIWNVVLEAPWWQLATIFLVAILTQYFAHVFLLRRNKKDRIIELAGKLRSAGRKLRHDWVSFLEYDLSFIQTRDKVGRELNAKKQLVGTEKERFDIGKEAAFNYEKSALHFREKLQDERAEFIDAGVILTSVHNERFSKQQEFKDAINAIENAYFKTNDFSNVQGIKKAVDTKINPNLRIIEQLCQRIIWEESASRLSKIGDFFKYLFRKKPWE